MRKPACRCLRHICGPSDALLPSNGKSSRTRTTTRTSTIRERCSIPSCLFWLSIPCRASPEATRKPACLALPSFDVCCPASQRSASAQQRQKLENENDDEDEHEEANAVHPLAPGQAALPPIRACSLGADIQICRARHECLLSSCRCLPCGSEARQRDERGRERFGAAFNARVHQSRKCRSQKRPGKFCRKRERGTFRIREKRGQLRRRGAVQNTAGCVSCS